MINSLHFFGIISTLKSENRIRIKYNIKLTQDVKSTQCETNKQDSLC